MLELLIKIAAAYLLGSIMGGLLLGKIVGTADIRLSGSRNAGATNALRTQGMKFGLLVMAFDLLKGVVAVTVIPALGLVPAHPWVAPESIALICGVAAVLGHVYPIFYGLRGGKGAATLTGVFLCLLPVAMPFLLALWVVVVVLTGFVGLATILAAVGAIIAVGLFYPQGLLSPTGLFTLVTAALVVFTHRANIGRMLRGEENQFSKAMLLHRS